MSAVLYHPLSEPTVLSRLRIIFTTAVIVVALLSGLGGGIYALGHYVDTTRILYKRWKAKSPELYETVSPALSSQDPTKFISVLEKDEAEEKRYRLKVLMLPGLDSPASAPLGELIEPTEEGLDSLSAVDGVARLEAFRVSARKDVFSTYYRLQPEGPIKGRPVIFQNGFGGGLERVSGALEDLLEGGRVVYALNQMGYGGNTLFIKSIGHPVRKVNAQFDMDQIDRPLELHFIPMFSAINRAVAESPDGKVDVIGFSAGAVMAVMAGAIDLRIKNVIPVAGVFPDYLRTQPQEVPVGVAAYSKLRDEFSYLDLFVLGSTGPDREQMQIFNRFDRCCYMNSKGMLYKDAVSKTVEGIGEGGHFDVFIDESHADHKVSDVAVAEILSLK